MWILILYCLSYNIYSFVPKILMILIKAFGIIKLIVTNHTTFNFTAEYGMNENIFNLIL